jgi:hypothetical protein
VGARSFFFTDDEFNGSLRRLRLMSTIIGEQLDDIRWFAWLRLDRLTERALVFEDVPESLIRAADEHFGDAEAIRWSCVLRRAARRGRKQRTRVLPLPVEVEGTGGSLTLAARR